MIQQRLLLGILALGLGCGDVPAVPAEAATCRRALGEPAGGALTWRVPADVGERTELDRYCAGVGPAIVLGTDAPTAPVDLLVAVSWNVGIGAGDLDRLVSDLESGAIAGVPAGLPIVLLLQEAGRSGDVVPSETALPPGTGSGSLRPLPAGRDIVAWVRARGWSLVYAPSMRNGSGQAGPAFEDRGNAIVSSLALTEPGALELPVGLRRRVALQASAGGVRFVSAHLDNFAWRRPVASLGAIRARQARWLLAMVPDGGAAVLGADLNTWLRGGSEAAATIVRARFDRPAVPAAATAERLSFGRTLDYLLLDGDGRWRLDVRVAAERYGSDHHPVIGVLSPAL